MCSDCQSPICLMGQFLLSHQCWEDKNYYTIKNGDVLLYKKVKCSGSDFFLGISERRMSFRNGTIQSYNSLGRKRPLRPCL